MGLVRVCGAALASGVLLAGLTGCSLSFHAGPTTTAPGSDLAADLTSRLQQRNVTVDAGSVRCPAELTAEVGSSVLCELTTNGQPVGVLVTTTSTGGGSIGYRTTFQPRPVPKAVLERAVAAAGRGTGIAIPSVTCDGDLAPATGKTQYCTVSGGGRRVPATVTVTGVDAGLIKYVIDVG